MLQRHLKFLVTEVYKSTPNLNPKFMFSFCTHKENQYNLMKGQVLSLHPSGSTYYQKNSLHFRGCLIWNNLPSYIKPSRSICELKNNIRIPEIFMAVVECANKECLLLLFLLLFSLLLYSVVSFY